MLSRQSTNFLVCRRAFFQHERDNDKRYVVSVTNEDTEGAAGRARLQLPPGKHARLRLLADAGGGGSPSVVPQLILIFLQIHPHLALAKVCTQCLK